MEIFLQPFGAQTKHCTSLASLVPSCRPLAWAARHLSKGNSVPHLREREANRVRKGSQKGKKVVMLARVSVSVWLGAHWNMREMCRNTSSAAAATATAKPECERGNISFI